jgi:hypothetical protein
MASNRDYAYAITVPYNKSMPLVFSIPDEYTTTTTNDTHLFWSMPPWNWQDYCFRQRVAMLTTTTTTSSSSFSSSFDESLYRFATPTEDGYRFFFPSYNQSDMLLVPTKWKSSFLRAALPHVQHQVFLECAFPTIVFWTLQQEEEQQRRKQQQQQQSSRKNNKGRNNKKQQEMATSSSSSSTTTISTTTTVLDDYQSYTQLFHQSVTPLPICTSWEADGTRGKPQMIEDCLQTKQSYGFVHPIKLSWYSHEEFAAMLDRIQHPPHQQPSQPDHPRNPTTATTPSTTTNSVSQF